VKPRTLACLLAVVSPLACGRPEPSLDEVELGVDVRLNAVEVDPFNETFIAVGSGGTVVHEDGRVWDLGDIELRDIVRAPDDVESPSIWMVVGDSGTIVVGRQLNFDSDIEWMVQESGTSANLYGIDVIHETTPIVVGDEIVLMGQPTAESGMFEWLAHPIPPGGWGRLRDVDVEYAFGAGLDFWVRATGLQGRIWLGVPGFGDEWEWQSIDAGTDEDLFDIYSEGRICGTRGTIVTCGNWWGNDPSDCTSKSFGEYDFLSCHDDGRIDSVRRIHSWDEYFPVEWQPRAIDEGWGRVVVGDQGRAGWWRPVVPIAL
jgi:hypothetical protein